MEKTKSFKSLLKMQEKMNLIVAVAKSQDLIQIEQDFKFRCVHCGECCKSYEHGIFLGVEDLIHWVKEEREYLLGCISFDKFTQKFRVISKQEFFSNAIKNPKTKREIISLNPRLEAQSKTKENEKTFQEYCVFFDEGKQRCSIYPFRPLICRLYPFPEQQAIRIKFQKLKSLIESFLGISRTKKENWQTKSKKNQIESPKLMCPENALIKTIRPDIEKLSNNIYKEIIGNFLLGPYNFTFENNVVEPILKEMLYWKEKD